MICQMADCQADQIGEYSSVGKATITGPYSVRFSTDGDHLSTESTTSASCFEPIPGYRYFDYYCYLCCCWRDHYNYYSILTR